MFEDDRASIKTAGLIGDKFIKIDPGGSGNLFKPEWNKHWCLLIFLLIRPLSAYSGPPLKEVKIKVTRVLDGLLNPAFRGEAGKKAKKEKISAISNEMFDFTELSKRSLGQNWNKMNGDQRKKEFVRLFKSLLEDTYADKITAYTDEKLVFGKEISLSEKTVEVQTTVVAKTSTVQISYRVIEEKGHRKKRPIIASGSFFLPVISNRRPVGMLARGPIDRSVKVQGQPPQAEGPEEM